MSSAIEQQVEDHMEASALPGMKIVSATGPEEPSLGGEDVRDVVEKPAGVQRAFPLEEEPEQPEQPEEPTESVDNAEPETESTSEETEEKTDTVDSFMDRLGFKKKPKASSEEPPEENKEDASEDADAPQEEEPEEPQEAEEPEQEEATEKPKRKRKRVEGIDAEDIKEIIRETAQSVSQNNLPHPEQVPEPQAKPESEIEKKNKSDLDAFGEMESDPRYSGIRARYLEYLTKLSDYKAQWTKENSDSQFNLDDIEHEEFIASNQPKYDANDFSDAKITVKARALVQEQDSKYRQELDDLRASVEEGNMKEELQTASNSSIAEVVKIADESYLKVVQDGGGDALKDADPIAHDVLNDVLAQHDKHLYELEKLSHPSKKFRVNSNNKIHQELLEFAAKKEADISKLPAKDQMHEGKRFATARQWASIPQGQRANYWTLQPEHIKAMYISDIGSQAKQRIDGQREVFDKYVKHKSGQKSSPKENKEVKKTQQKRAKVNPPSITGEAVSATGSSNAASVDIGEKSNMKKRLWG